MNDGAPKPERRLRWGVLGVASIARRAVIPAIQQSQCGRVVAIASRDGHKAESAARELDIPAAHGSYDALLADPNVDAIYNPLPNHLHVPWSIRVMEAGKHVLCEKPIGLSAADAERLRAAQVRTGMLCAEAFMVRSHPRWHAVRELIARGRIGPLQLVTGHFSYFRIDPTDVRSKREWGGGVLMDIGCYPIMIARWLFGAEPQSVLCDMDIDPALGVDRLVSAVLLFPNGRATFTCGGQLAPHQVMHCFGPSGRIQIDMPFNAPPDQPSIVQLSTTTPQGQQSELLSIAPVNQYALQADDFARAVWGLAALPMPLDDSIGNMRVIDALVRSAASGQWESPTAHVAESRPL